MDELTCPTCSAKIPPPKPDAVPTWFPFCSQRCKTIDLGRWADGNYIVPGRAVLDPEADEFQEND
jgi:endogenous inhibitor of DNA gyrase (YacG/DUF329 family)